MGLLGGNQGASFVICLAPEANGIDIYTEVNTQQRR